VTYAVTVAISTASEFEAIMGQALIKLDKVLYERGNPPKLKQARRDLDKILSFSREPAKLKQHGQLLNTTAEVIRVEVAHDHDLHNSLWDCSDYIDFGC